MTDSMSRASKIILIMAVVVLSIAYVKNLADNSEINRKSVVKLVPVQDPNYIPSVREIQQRLKDTGKPRYDPGKIDGIPGPKTIEGWDNHTKDQYAIRAFRGIEQ